MELRHLRYFIAPSATQLNLISVGMGIGLVVTGAHFTYPSGVRMLPLEDVQYPTMFVFGWVKGQNDPAVDRMIDVIDALGTQP